MRPKAHVASYAFLTLAFLNSLFILQIFFRLSLRALTAEQWVLVIGNILLFCLSLATIERKEPLHHSRNELTLFQFLFSLNLIISLFFLVVLLLQYPTAFMIFMPFEFFVLAFYVGIYFLLSRHILPTRKFL